MAADESRVLEGTKPSSWHFALGTCYGNASAHATSFSVIWDAHSMITNAAMVSTIGMARGSTQGS